MLNNFTQLNIQNKRINPKNKVDLNWSIIFGYSPSLSCRKSQVLFSSDHWYKLYCWECYSEERQTNRYCLIVYWSNLNSNTFEIYCDEDLDLIDTNLKRNDDNKNKLEIETILNYGILFCDHFLFKERQNKRFKFIKTTFWSNR